MARWRGAKGLVFDGIVQITGLVERTILSVGERSTSHLEQVPGLESPARLVRTAHSAATRFTCTTIRVVARGVEAVTDLGSEQSVARPALGTSLEQRSDRTGSMPWALDQLEGALNAAIGDFLAVRDNELALALTFRHQGRAIAPQDLSSILIEPTPFVCVFVHGLGTTEWCWTMSPQPYAEGPTTYAERLAADLDATSLFVRYNTGQPVADSGQALSQLLEQLLEFYPGGVERLALIGHSMGGLVARSAALDGRARELRWPSLLGHLVCLGSPHLGAPLERAAHRLHGVFEFVDVAATRVLGEILGARSRGIHDLGEGLLTKEACSPARISGPMYCAVASTVSTDTSGRFAGMVGDMLVPTKSALSERVEFDRLKTFGGINHIQLTNHPSIYPTLVQWLDERS